MATELTVHAITGQNPNDHNRTQVTVLEYDDNGYRIGSFTRHIVRQGRDWVGRNTDEVCRRHATTSIALTNANDALARMTDRLNRLNADIEARGRKIRFAERVIKILKAADLKPIDRGVKFLSQMKRNQKDARAQAVALMEVMPELTENARAENARMQDLLTNSPLRCSFDLSDAVNTFVQAERRKTNVGDTSRNK